MNKRLCQSLSIFVMGIGCLVLLGWQLNIPLLKSGWPSSLSTMKPNTALCFVLLGISLRLLQSQTVTRVRHQIAKLMALLVVIIGSLTIIEYYFNWNLGIDLLLRKDLIASAITPYPGRMGINTAVNFILMANALLCLEKNKPKDIVLAQIFSSIAAIISLLALLGHLLGVIVLTQLIAYTSTQALHTAITFLILYSGLLLTKPEQGLMRVFTSPLIGGSLARRLIPWIILCPLALNISVLTGYQIGWYDLKAAYGLDATLTIASLFMLVWCSAYWLNKIDSERIKVEKALTESQQEFQQAVEAANLGTWKWDILTGKVGLSSQGEALFGLKYGSFAGTYEAWINLLGPDDLDAFSNSLQLTLLQASRWQMDHQILEPNGSQRWITSLGKFLYNAAGDAVQMIGIVKDITPRKQAELYLTEVNETLEKQVSERTVQLSELNNQLQKQLLECGRIEAALRSSEERLSRILAIASEAIISIDNSQKIILFNQAAEQMFGYSQEEVLGQPLSLLLPDRFKNVHHHHVTKFAETSGTKRGMGKRGKVAGRRKDGSEFPAEASISQLTINNETILTVILQDITERKQAEETLQKYANEITDLYNNSPCGYHSLDSNGIFVHINDTELYWLGLTREQVIGKLKFTDLITAKSKKVFEKNFPELKKRGWVKDLEFEIIRSNGEILYVLLNATAIKDAQGNLLFSRSTIFDISDRKQIETALKESEERFRFLITHAPVGIYQTDAQGACQYVNPRWMEMTGLSVTEALGTGWTKALHPDDRERVEQEWFSSTAESRPFALEYRYLKPDGQEVWISGNAVAFKDETGAIKNYFGTVMDISDVKHREAERQQAQANLRESEERLQLALEASGDGLWDWNIETGTFYYSPRYLTMLGYEPDEFPQDLTTWERLVHRDDLIWAKNILKAHLEDNSISYAFDYRLRTKSGQWKWIANYGKVVAWNREGKPLRMSGTHKDISERKGVELELQKAKEKAIAANQAKSIFLANMRNNFSSD